MVGDVFSAVLCGGEVVEGGEGGEALGFEYVCLRIALTLRRAVGAHAVALPQGSGMGASEAAQGGEKHRQQHFVSGGDLGL